MENTIFYTEKTIQKAVDFVLLNISKKENQAVVICLEGDLGAGKTTLSKEVIKSFGYIDQVQSPTFVISKTYPVKHTFEKIIHIDAYRIEDDSELIPIGFDKIIKDSNNLILIEWASNIKKSIPQNALWFKLDYKEDGRSIKIYEGEK